MSVSMVVLPLGRGVQESNVKHEGRELQYIGAKANNLFPVNSEISTGEASLQGEPEAKIINKTQTIFPIKNDLNPTEKEANKQTFAKHTSLN